MDKLSIVITSYTTDRLNDIYDLLISIKTQTYEYIEVVYIVERSEELYRILKDYSSSLKLPIHLILSQEKLGLGGARNLGSNESIGDIIAFIDDDVVLENDWAEEMVKSYSSEDIIGVTGSAYPLWKDKEINLPKELYWLISCSGWTGWEHIVEVRNLWGGNMSFRREAFDKAGSFSTKLGYNAVLGEDVEYSIRVRMITGKKLIFNPKASVGHKVYGYRVGFKFVIVRSYVMGTARRLLKGYKEYGKSTTEGTALRGVLKSLFKTPLIASLVIISAGLGYVLARRKYAIQ